MASIYHSMDAPLQAATAPAQGQLDKLPPATSCCFGATTLLIGIKLSCLWYMFKAFFAVVVPVLFSLNMKDGWGGIDGRDEHFCQFPGGNCPTIAATMCSPSLSAVVVLLAARALAIRRLANGSKCGVSCIWGLVSRAAALKLSVCHCP